MFYCNIVLYAIEFKNTTSIYPLKHRPDKILNDSYLSQIIKGSRIYILERFSLQRTK